MNNEIVFDTIEHGKPMLENNDKFYFNISYTHNIIVLVISEGEIGVDVKKLIPCNFKIIDRSFTKHEKEYIFSSFPVDEAFTEIWTKKEAYTKYKGTGLSMPLRSFCVFDKAISDKIYTINIKGYFISFCENLITSFKIIEISELDFLSDEVSKLI